MRYVPRGSLVLAATTLGSYLMGFGRDRIFAQTFGASTNLDAYNAAFLVPDFAFNLLVASGIAAAGVPLFVGLSKRGRQEGEAYINGLLMVAVVMMAVMGVVVFLTAPELAQLVAPGLGDEARVLVARLIRVLAWSPILFAASNALGAMLVAQRRFLFYGLSPIFYNVGIIGGALWLAPNWGIVGVAYGTLGGAGLHLLMRLVDAWRNGWQFDWRWRMPAGMMKRTIRLMAPKVLGHPVEMATFWVFTGLASLLAPGSITVLNFARNFQSVPVSVLGITMATAVFPVLAEAALGKQAELRRLFTRTGLTVGGLAVAAALVMFLARRPLVQILLGGGAFDEVAVATTAAVLGVFTLAIPTESLNHLLARVFYARQNTVIPVVFSLVSLVVAGTSAYFLIDKMGIVGLPLGFFWGSLAKTIGLFSVFWFGKR